MLPKQYSNLFPREIAYINLGKETLVKNLVIEFGECDFCSGRLSNEVYPTVKFFSKNFTEWDKFLEFGSMKKYICTKCAWFFSEKTLRIKSLYIKKIKKKEEEYIVDFIDFERLSDILKKSFIEHESLTVSFSGRKHLVPYMQWQHICTDDGNVFWGSRESEMFNDVFFLRSLNIPVSVISREKSLTSIKFSELQKTHLTQILIVWNNLESWNKSLAFKLACHVVKGFSVDSQPIPESIVLDRISL